MKKNTRIWFQERPSGLGWAPVAWQGWAVVLVWVAVFAGFVAWSNIRFTNVWLSMTVSILFGGLWMGVLYGLVSMKGEKPHRRPADKSGSDSR